MKPYKTSLLLCALLALFTGYAQSDDLSAHVLRGTWQASLTNPALLPKGRLTISLPGVYNNLLITNITYNDLVRVDANGQTVLDVQQAIGQLEASNILRQNLDIETFGIGLDLGPLALTLGHRLRFNAFLDYPQTLPKLIWEGNAQYIGQQVSFDTDLDLVGYHEWSLGGVLQVGELVSVGGRVKYLSGVAGANTERNRLQLTTDEDIYELQLDADLLINSAGALEFDGFRDIGLDFNFGRYDTERFFSNNSGLAFDLGVAVDVGKLHLAASALDLGGRISWKNDPRNYSLQGQYVFEGLDVAQQILEDSTQFSAILDSLEATYQPTETSQSFTTQIGTRYYLSGLVDLTDSWQIGGLFFLEQYRERSFPALAATASWQVLPFLRLGALYAWRNERADNLGLNTLFHFGPLRVLAATDNIITAFRPKDSHTANFRLGVNLIFD